ncbi:MAG: hypothetical protein ABF709_00525 [Leuconostoc pseudomesenteroides]|uniref:hypothetical protein n=1 Tax=Leuconostoc pseudomesenteroides TaxID=33968 RepID=UPI0039E87CB9
MSKLKSALLIGVALSPIFVSATRGIEVVHAEVVQNAVAQQVKKATEVKPVKGTDEKKTDDKKVDTVTAASQGDSDIDNTRSEKPNIIAFSDKDFLQKFKATNYYQQQVAMYGENKPGADAALAAQGASYLSSIIGEAFIKAESKPTIMKALGFAGPIGALLSCMIDWLTPAARNKTDEKLDEINKKLDDLGIHLDHVGSAISDQINEAKTETKLEDFKKTIAATRTPFGTVAGEISQYQAGHNITLASKDKDDVKTYVNEYAKLYRTTEWGFDNKSQEVSGMPNSENLTVFKDLCAFGKAIVSGDINQNNIFRVMSNYESLREFFNTQTFATREAFAEYVMSHYTVWASDMMTAIFFDYFRVKGQLDLITASDEYKESVTAAKTNGTTIDKEFQKSYPISYSLFNNLRSNARNDLMRLGYDVTSEKGHNNSYDLDEYDKNQWVDKYNNNSVSLGAGETDILGANINAVNYAYAREVENKPVKIVVGIDPAYQEKLATAKQKATNADAEENRTHYAHPFYSMDWHKALEAQKAAHEALDQLVASGGNIYQDKVLEDANGNPIVGKLKAEEKTSNDGKMLYSYRNNKWVYSKLVSGPAAYAAKHMVEKNKTDLDDVKNKSIGYKGGGSTAVDYFDICWTHNTDLPANPSWNAVFEKALTSDDLLCLNTAAATRNKIGINSLLSNTVTHVVNGVTQLGFSEIGKTGRIIGDGDYKLAIDPAHTWYTPGYTIGLGYYQNNKHTNPSVDQKTVYQNFSYVGTYKDSKTNEYVQDYHDKHYDQEDVTFIRGVKDGDSELGALNNGNKTPVAPEHFVE